MGVQDINSNSKEIRRKSFIKIKAEITEFLKRKAIELI